MNRLFQIFTSLPLKRLVSLTFLVRFTTEIFVEDLLINVALPTLLGDDSLTPSSLSMPSYNTHHNTADVISSLFTFSAGKKKLFAC